MANASTFDTDRCARRAPPLRALTIPGIEILEELATGLQSTVYRARHGHDIVAVKVQTAAASCDNSQMFFSEAGALASFTHPSLARTLHVGQVGGRPYVVMQYVPGETLAARLLRLGALPEADVVRIGGAVAAALTALHRRRLVHRDVSATNIIIDPQGQVTLMNFGFGHQPLDDRADVYALGAVLFECATGTPLSQRQEGSRAAPAVQSLRPELSDGLSAIIDKLVAWEPSQRYGQAAALAQDLEHLEAINRRLGAGQAADLSGQTPLGHASEHAPLCGRDGELAELMRLWQATPGSQGRVALITGELGLGKSRLMAAFTDAAQRDGALVLHASQDGECSEPFMPLAAALTDLARILATLPEPKSGALAQHVRHAMGDNAALLTRYVPALQSVCGAGPGKRRLAAVSQLSGALQQFFAALGHRCGGLILAIDDVQASEPASLRRLMDLLFSVCEAPVLVVLGVRDPVPTPLAEDMRRACDATGGVHVPLGRLPESALRTVLVDMLGTADLDANLVRALTNRAHGNPWVLREYVRALLASGALRPAWGQWDLDTRQLGQVPLPTDVLQLITHRVAQLRPATQKVLQVAALLGPAFERQSLEQCVDGPAHATWTALDEAMHLRILESSSQQTYRFVHEAVAEALVASLTPLAQQQQHLRIAQTLDAQPQRDDAQLYRVAQHYAQAAAAEPEQRARTYSTNRAAGLRAAAACTYDQARTYLRTALSSAPDEAAPRDYALHQTLGEVCLALGQRSEALQALAAAWAAARTPLERAHVAALRATTFHVDEDGDGAWEALTQGYNALGYVPPAGWRCLRHLRQRSAEGAINDMLRRLHDLAIKLALQRNQATVGAPALLLTVLLATTPAHWARIYTYGACMVAQWRWTFLARLLLRRAERHARAAGDAEVLRVQLATAWITHFAGDERRATSLAQVCLSESGAALDHEDFATACRGLVHTLVRRGYGSEAADWLERLHDRLPVRTRPNGETLRTPLARCVAELLGRAATQPLRELAAAPFDEALADVFVYTEHGELGPPLERAMAACVAHLHEANAFQRQTFLVWRAYARRAQWEHGRLAALLPRRPQLFAQAVRSLRAQAHTSPVVACHGAIAAASLARVQGQRRRARRWLRRAEALAFAQADLTAHFEIARERARLARAEGDLDAMLLMAQSARALALDHGWITRLRHLSQEFGLELPTAAIVDRDPPLSKTRRERDALVRTSLASCQCEATAFSVHGALCELLQTLGAHRAAYFACEPGPDLTLAAALDGDGNDVHAAFLPVPRLVVHAHEECRVAFSEACEGEGRNALAVPLRRADRVVGVVYVDNVGRMPFGPDDGDMVAAVAAHVPLALAAQRGNRLDFYEKITADMPGVLFQLERRTDGTRPVHVFTMVSAGAQALLGVPAQALEQDIDAWLELLDGEGRARFFSALQHSATMLTPLTWQGRLLRDGKETWVQARARPGFVRPTLDTRGTLQWTGIFYDVTEEKHGEQGLERALADVAELAARERHRAEALMDTRDQLMAAQHQLVAAQGHLVQKEKMSALGRLANGLAHEINNPLGGVQHLVSALHDPHALSADQRDEYVALIQAGLGRIQSTVTNLMTYAQPQPPSLKPRDVRLLVQEAIERVRPAARTKGVRLHVDTPTLPVTIWADGHQLVEAMVNVLQNALHASRAQGTVRAEVTDNDAGVRVTIRDRGMGIPAEYLHRVCDPFFTTKQQGEGNGLGLSTAQWITVAHGGELRVVTQEGRGTDVLFELPKTPAHVGSAS